MYFFDFHLHPTTKCLFSHDVAADPDVRKLSPWEFVDLRKIPFLLKWCTEFTSILETQSNLSQLAYNECTLVCSVLYIPEKQMLDHKLIWDGAKSKLKKYLHEEQIRHIIDGNPYEILINEDWPLMTDAARFGITDRRVKPIRKRTDFNEGEDGTVHMVFTVEGCHTLSDGLQTFNVPVIKQNLDNLLTMAAVISINLTHIEQSTLCNHAFGMLFVDHIKFKPTGNKISNDGIDVIKHFYSRKVMIDVKHMALASRLHLYKLRETTEFQAIKQPIACTHAGFTGIKIKEIPDYIFDYKRAGGNAGHTRLLQNKPVKYGGAFMRPAFNASSINLYDEDIMAILNSGGMIGLSLDKRILGYQQYENNSNAREEYPMEIEYVSWKEENLFLPAGPNAMIRTAAANGTVLEWEQLLEGGTTDPMLSEYHLRHFMAHVLHYFVVVQDAGYDFNTALSQLCIGSDYDGLINPIWVCETTDQLIYFKERFQKSFMDFANESGITLPATFDIKSFSTKLFYENGKEFVLNRLDVMAL